MHRVEIILEAPEVVKRASFGSWQRSPGNLLGAAISLEDFFVSGELRRGNAVCNAAKMRRTAVPY